MPIPPVLPRATPTIPTPEEEEAYAADNEFVDVFEDGPAPDFHLKLGLVTKEQFAESVSQTIAAKSAVIIDPTDGQNELKRLRVINDTDKALEVERTFRFFDMPIVFRTKGQRIAECDPSMFVGISSKSELVSELNKVLDDSYVARGSHKSAFVESIVADQIQRTKSLGDATRNALFLAMREGGTADLIDSAVLTIMEKGQLAHLLSRIKNEARALVEELEKDPREYVIHFWGALELSYLTEADPFSD